MVRAADRGGAWGCHRHRRTSLRPLPPSTGRAGGGTRLRGEHNSGSFRMMTAVPSDSAATIHGTYDKLIALLDRNGAAYRLIDHPPEGQTELVSALRGHQVAAAA